MICGIKKRNYDVKGCVLSFIVLKRQVRYIHDSKIIDREFIKTSTCTNQDDSSRTLSCLLWRFDVTTGKTFRYSE